MIFQKIKSKIKNFFSPIFDTEKKEGGGIPLIGYLLITAVLSVGGYAVWFNAEAILGEATYAAGNLLYILAKTVYNKIAAPLFEYVASANLLKRSITRDPVVIEGWTIVRDFANMFIVLGFVVIGIATILRVREYEAQKRLLPLIIVALLVNFSLLFSGIIIDATNITMGYFLKTADGAALTQQFHPLVNSPEIDSKISSEKTKDTLAGISAVFSAAIFIGIITMLFIIYGILFLFRYVALMCLVILAPLGLVCYVFPASHPVFKRWWDQFLQWAIIGIPSAFFIYLGAHLMQTMANTAQDDWVLAFWVPTGFLFFAYSLIFQTSAFGAAAAMGLATGGARYAMGAGKWTGGKLLKGAGAVTGASRLGSAMKSKALGYAEKMRLVAPGTAAAPERKAIDDYKKQFANLSNQQIGDNLDKKAVWTRGGVRQKAALAEMAIERGTFDPNNANHVAGLRHAQSRGFQLTDKQMEKDPRLASLDPSTMAGLKKKGFTEADAVGEAIKQRVQGQTEREFTKNTTTGALKSPEVLLATNKKQMKYFIDRGPAKKRNALRELFKTKAGKKQLQNYANSLITAGKTKELVQLARMTKYARSLL